MSDGRQVMPLLPLQSTVVFPSRVSTVQVGAEDNVRLLQEHGDDDAEIALAFRLPGTGGAISTDNLCDVAIVGRVLDRLKLPGNCLRVTVQGLRRVSIAEIIGSKPYHTAAVEPVEEDTSDPFKVNVHVQRALNLYERLVAADREYSKELLQILKMNVDENPVTPSSYRVTGIPNVQKFNTLNHAAAINIKAGNNALGQTH